MFHNLSKIRRTLQNLIYNVNESIWYILLPIFSSGKMREQINLAVIHELPRAIARHRHLHISPIVERFISIEARNVYRGERFGLRRSKVILMYPFCTQNSSGTTKTKSNTICSESKNDNTNSGVKVRILTWIIVTRWITLKTYVS